MDSTIKKITDLSQWQGMLSILSKNSNDQYYVDCLKRQDAGDLYVFAVMTCGADEGAEVAAGYVVLNKMPKYSLYARLGMYEVQDLNVLPAYRQRGLGAALIRHCEDLARHDGCESIGISVGLSASFGPAQRLYCKLGYLPDGQGVTYDRMPVTHGRQVTLDDDLCLMMIKDL